MRAEAYEVALRHALLSAEEELALLKRYRDLRDEHGATDARAIKVRNQLVTANLRMVAKLARRHGGTHLGKLDTLAEGAKGLIRAIESFDPDRGLRLSTYAHWWVRHYVQRARENHGSTIRLPVFLQHQLRQGGVRDDGLLPLRQPYSLDMPLSGHEGADTYHNVVADETAPADEQLARRADALDVQRLLRVLTRREREVIVRRFGLQVGPGGVAGDGDGETLQEIGTAFDLSRERIRQVERDAMEKLRKALARASGEAANDTGPTLGTWTNKKAAR